ncbi:hypothetical protein [Smaragdicoccus niigatensis]|uniref:hypothetical protein n=1 Tax=Smaragdicoccus niigatensis TaxID=359359 RepID=UPI0003823F00|nr:hypothetical protein [Smaragdicoccus niigatensis]
METVLSEIGELIRQLPTATASAKQKADWYERKARLFDHVAADPAADREDAATARAIATRAREHGRKLRAS